ncbi:hypothetical protein [Clavibacter michiganensis]|uniref:hypothetical protein n=1 Tax=Clavibacter michiganensis TaxID=28447 RepID=UPI0015E22301|nr:hypothetical protein [Clavibacter michiganensis]
MKMTKPPVSDDPYDGQAEPPEEAPYQNFDVVTFSALPLDSSMEELHESAVEPESSDDDGDLKT